MGSLTIRLRFMGSIAAGIAMFFLLPRLHAQTQSGANPSKPAAVGDRTGDQKFDPHDLTGTWTGYSPRPGIRNFASYDQKTPEPPLTDWAKQHLLVPAITHDALGGTPIPGKTGPGHVCPNNQDPCYSADPNGVPANAGTGEYPGKDCEPMSTPGEYDVPGLGSMEIFPTPDGTRMYQLFAYHREWRTWWLNRDHPRDLDPSFEGDSTAHWEGNTLVVDTIGYNGKTMLTQNVGHWKSDAFHLVERFTRVDHDHMQLDMTYYDPKAWGDKSWPGFHVYYKLTAKENFEEFICSPREYMEYNKRMKNDAVSDSDR
jgi:hypothetical protein